MGVPRRIWTQDLPHPKPVITHSTPHLHDAARPAFPYPYRPTGDDAVETNFFMLFFLLGEG